MTVFGPDVSQYQDGLIPPEPHGIGFSIGRASIGTMVDPTVVKVRDWAKAKNVPFVAYHFVYPTSTHSAAAQAKTFHDSVGPNVNCMIDWESDTNDNCHPDGGPQKPSWDDVLKVAAEIRKLGHKITLLYAPDWYWSECGKPSMGGQGFDLVTAEYGSKPWPTGNASQVYAAIGGDASDKWRAYGGLTPVLLQFSCQVTWGNKQLDMNAYKGNPAYLNEWFTDWKTKMYPYAYSGTMLTMEQLEAKQTVYKLHPEFWRRFKALMQFAEAKGVQLGVGTGWRVQPTNPDGSTKPGFAAPGNSNHEGFPADGKAGGAVAIDAVGDLHFMELNLKAYGLRSFIQPSTTGYKGSNEPWHVQPVEIPASRNFRTTPWTLTPFQLPGENKPPPSPEILATPPGSPSFKEGATNASTTMPGAPYGRVTWLQTILRDEYVGALIPDGQFGPKTSAALKIMQTSLKVVVDGIYGTQTASARLAKVGK